MAMNLFRGMFSTNMPFCLHQTPPHCAFASWNRTGHTPTRLMKPDNILNFWFNELSPEDWYTKSDGLDSEIQEKFGVWHQSAVAGELDSWRQTAEGALAEIIILDQFSRNIYRDSSLSFAQDGQALVLSQEAIAKGFDRQLASPKVEFLYMPFMHSESRIIHQRALELFRTPGLEDSLGFEIKHKEIIDRFGRYPHRNKILGRPSTFEEEEFLKQPGSSF